MKIDFDLLRFQTDDDGRSITFNLKSVLKLPLRLDAFDYVSGTIRFPFFKTAFISESSTTITVAFYTSRRTYRKKVQLTELSELFLLQYPQRRGKAE